MRETVIVEAVRTPVGKRNGGLSEMHAADLSVRRAQLAAQLQAGFDQPRAHGKSMACMA